MALKDNASLALIPAAYKTSKVYSALPTDGDGDFTFSRTGSATRVNKAGLIETMASNEPRLDYPLVNGVVQSCPTLLLEPSRINLITDYTGAGFSAFNGASITANDSTSPDGSTNATLMTTTGGGNQVIQQASISISSGQSYTISGYFRLKSGTLTDNDNAFKGLDGFSGGITGSTFNSSITSEWQRLSFTITSTTTSGRVQIKCENAAEILIWGLQVELGSYKTTVIPTSGSAVTRNADVCNGAGDSSTFNDSEGVLFVEVAALANDGTTREMALSDGGASNRIELRYISSANVIQAVIRGAASTIVLSYGLADATEFAKVAVKYKSGDYALWVNGVERVPSTTPGTPTGLSEFAFDDGAGNFNIYAKIKQAMVFNTALTDSELEELTS